MKPLRYNAGFAAAAFVLSLAVAIDWICGIWLKTPLVARFGMLGLGIMLSGSALWAVLGRTRQQQRGAQRYLNLMCQDQFTADSDASLELPGAELDAEWTNVFQQIRDTIARHAKRADILEQEHAALEIRARRNDTRAQRVEAILTGLPEPVVAINDYDEVILTNPSADRLFEIGNRTTEERALARLIRCEQLVELLTDTRRRKAPSQRTAELELPDEEGRQHWYSVTARSVRALGSDAGDGDGQGAVAVLRDVSVQKAAQKRNAEFVSAVSHEMKTPLAGIKAYTELMIDGDADDAATREECLSVISGQANRLQRLVDNLLNLARIEAGVVTVSKQSRPLNELLEEALSVVQPSAEAKQITLVRDLSPMYLGVFIDRDMLLQAAINLLSNAIKYTPAGGRVTLRSRLVDKEASFEVEDTGVGLSPEDSRRVFEKFYRVQSSKEMAAGTGLGLPLAKHIVEDVHGGRMTVESVLGRGSNFRVALPNAGQQDR